MDKPAALILDRMIPENITEAKDFLDFLAENYTGGFHPDDDPAEIIDMSGTPMFPDANVAAWYRACMAACFIHFDEADEDLYEYNLRVSGYEIDDEEEAEA